MFPWSIIMYTIRYLTLTHVYFNNPLWTSKKNQSCLRLGAMIFHFKNIPLDEINFGRLQISINRKKYKGSFFWNQISKNNMRKSKKQNLSYLILEGLLTVQS